MIYFFPITVLCLLMDHAAVSPLVVMAATANSEKSGTCTGLFLESNRFLNPSFDRLRMTMVATHSL